MKILKPTVGFVEIKSGTIWCLDYFGKAIEWSSGVLQVIIFYLRSAFGLEKPLKHQDNPTIHNEHPMRPVVNVLTIITTIILFSCAATKPVSILYSDAYDKATDQTSVMIFPYGEVKIPGKWTKTRESEISGQHFFIGKDSIRIAIALQPWDKFEFSNNNPQVTPDNFVRKFYEWDATYLKEQTNGHLQIVKENTSKNYLIWNLSNLPIQNEYFLFGLKENIAYNIYISTDQWDEDKKVKFLEQLYGE